MAGEKGDSAGEGQNINAKQSAAELQLSPDDPQSFIKAEFLVRRYDRDAFRQRLRDNLAVEGIAVMKRQAE